MPTYDLLTVCGIAFLYVFAILVFLALIMRLIILIFPEKKALTDTAVVAALAAVVSRVFPGKKITKIEEQK